MKILSNIERALEREIRAIEEDDTLTDREKKTEIDELMEEFRDTIEEWFGEEDENY